MPCADNVNIMSGYSYSYGGGEVEVQDPTVYGIFNHTCVFPMDSTLTMVNGSIYVLDEPSCGDTHLFVLTMLLLSCGVLAYMKTGGRSVGSYMKFRQPSLV